MAIGAKPMGKGEGTVNRKGIWTLEIWIMAEHLLDVKSGGLVAVE